MSPKPASKYHSLVWLIELTKNNYQTKFGVEYNQWEVDQMILVKQAKKAQELARLNAKALKAGIDKSFSNVLVSYKPNFFNVNRTINFNNISLAA